MRTPQRKDGGVDGGDFDVDEGFAGFDVAEVVEEAVFVRNLVEMEVESSYDLFFDAISCEIATFVGDAKSAESKSGSGDAGGKLSIEFSRRSFVLRTVENLPTGRVGLLREVEAAGTLHLFKEEEILITQKSGIGWLGRGCLLCRKRRGCET